MHVCIFVNFDQISVDQEHLLKTRTRLSSHSLNDSWSPCVAGDGKLQDSRVGFNFAPEAHIKQYCINVFRVGPVQCPSIRLSLQIDFFKFAGCQKFKK